MLSNNLKVIDVAISTEKLVQNIKQRRLRAIYLQGEIEKIDNF